ncbi:hypothetical protein RHMOL_Rhmol08G0322400 [Rhododendron molle]|uniref:Uncharacterized protein n=1 Tax=Rhododendron molle TaxID=49168 RepID=A0ACC0MV69_RHOML|nr:hypothetical protein RHMOL_Rhmol08G0322400 [Rhododendron molle]
MDIQDYVKKGALLLRWVRRSANKTVHEVDSIALRKSFPCNWVFNPSTYLVTVLEKDIYGSL